MGGKSGKRPVRSTVELDAFADKFIEMRNKLGINRPLMAKVIGVKHSTTIQNYEECINYPAEEIEERINILMKIVNSKDVNIELLKDLIKTDPYVAIERYLYR